jgi:hypothetical protein
LTSRGQAFDELAVDAESGCCLLAAQITVTRTAAALSLIHRRDFLQRESLQIAAKSAASLRLSRSRQSEWIGWKSSMHKNRWQRNLFFLQGYLIISISKLPVA